MVRGCKVMSSRLTESILRKGIRININTTTSAWALKGLIASTSVSSGQGRRTAAGHRLSTRDSDEDQEDAFGWHGARFRALCSTLPHILSSERFPPRTIWEWNILPPEVFNCVKPSKALQCFKTLTSHD